MSSGCWPLSLPHRDIHVQLGGQNPELAELVESGVAAALSEGCTGETEKKADGNSLDSPPASPVGDSV
jgi:hypothetical protein